MTLDSAYENLAIANNNAYYLSASYQKVLVLKYDSHSLKYSKISFIEIIPFYSFTRKNVGYLLAINYGAEVICDFDNDNILLPLSNDNMTAPLPLFNIDLNFSRTVLLKFIEDEYNLIYNPHEFMEASHEY